MVVGNRDVWLVVMGGAYGARGGAREGLVAVPSSDGLRLDGARSASSTSLIKLADVQLRTLRSRRVGALSSGEDVRGARGLVGGAGVLRAGSKSSNAGTLHDTLEGSGWGGVNTGTDGAAGGGGCTSGGRG